MNWIMMRSDNTVWSGAMWVNKASSAKIYQDYKACFEACKTNGCGALVGKLIGGKAVIYKF